MCNLFIAVTPDSSERQSDYKLVLASNRDEYYLRPAKIADFWDEHPDIVGGRDMEPGREGGTWLAMNKSGRIGVLLNILTEAPDPTKLGRGNLDFKMCNLFIAVTPDSSERQSDYKLVLASNRDEYYLRPAKIADFWDEHPDIVGGRDMEPGREGGTWLAMNKSGRIGVLLNILTEAPDPTKLGRGNLVKDYLTSPDLNGYEYSQMLCRNASKYNEFNLVTLEVKNPEPEVSFFSSPKLDPMKLNPTDTKTMVAAFGNSAYETPFIKVADGKTQMTKVVGDFKRKSQKRYLINGLLEILECKTRFYPDPQMQKQITNTEFLEGMSSRYVEMPEHKYGSRTHTVILVDFENNVDYHEWTMMEPIVVNSPTKRWVHSQMDFSLT